MARASTHAEETIGIDSSGNSVSLDIGGRSTVELVISGDASADYAVDVRRTGGSWQQGVGSNYTGSSDYDDVRDHGAQEVRVRCTTGTSGNGDEADILVMASD
jgi:hypothetical protein